MKSGIFAFLCLALIGCTPSSPESDVFFQKFAATFTSDKEFVLLADATDFAWEDVCIFKADGPYPYVGYESYSEYTKAKNLDGNIPRGKFGLIFIFLDKGNIVREYFQTDSYLIVGISEKPLELASRKPFIKFCATSEGLILTPDQGSSALLISKQRPE